MQTSEIMAGMNDLIATIRNDRTVASKAKNAFDTVTADLINSKRIK